MSVRGCHTRINTLEQSLQVHALQAPPGCIVAVQNSNVPVPQQRCHIHSDDNVHAVVVASHQRQHSLCQDQHHQCRPEEPFLHASGHVYHRRRIPVGHQRICAGHQHMPRKDQVAAVVRSRLTTVAFQTNPVNLDRPQDVAQGLGLVLP